MEHHDKLELELTTQQAEEDAKAWEQLMASRAREWDSWALESEMATKSNQRTGRTRKRARVHVAVGALLLLRSLILGSRVLL